LATIAILDIHMWTRFSKTDTINLPWKYCLLGFEEELSISVLCWGLLVYLLPQLLKLFGFPTFRRWAYLMNVIPETRRANDIWYLHFNDRNATLPGYKKTQLVAYIPLLLKTIKKHICSFTSTIHCLTQHEYNWHTVHFTLYNNKST
jgi:hypothetical protein